MKVDVHGVATDSKRTNHDEPRGITMRIKMCSVSLQPLVALRADSDIANEHPRSHEAREKLSKTALHVRLT